MISYGYSEKKDKTQQKSNEMALDNKTTTMELFKCV